MAYLAPSSSRHKFKRQPIGWLGPSKGPSTSRGKASWRVIARGQVIASGFADRAYALRWIDSFNLMQAGYALNDRDRRQFLSHWRSRSPARRPRQSHPGEHGPGAQAPTESAPDSGAGLSEGVAAASDSRKQIPGSGVPIPSRSR
jgi:hypothetical protein